MSAPPLSGQDPHLRRHVDVFVLQVVAVDDVAVTELPAGTGVEYE